MASPAACAPASRCGRWLGTFAAQPVFVVELVRDSWDLWNLRVRDLFVLRGVRVCVCVCLLLLRFVQDSLSITIYIYIINQFTLKHFVQQKLKISKSRATSKCTLACTSKSNYSNNWDLQNGLLFPFGFP